MLRQHRVLICAITNIAADVIGQALVKKQVDFTRVGLPEKIHPTLQGYSIHSKALALERPRDPDSQWLEIEGRSTDWNRKMQGDIQASQELGFAPENVSKAARESMVAVMDSSSVVLSTVAGAGHWIFSSTKMFNDIIIDEAGQVTIPQSSIPLQHLLANGSITMIGGEQLV